MRSRLSLLSPLFGSLLALTASAAPTGLVEVVDDGSDYQFSAGEGDYRVRFNYTGENWTHADVAAIRVDTDAPIAVLPMQYTAPGKMMPGASVKGESIGQRWNFLTQQAMASRLAARGFFVLTPTITQYGEDLPGFQAFEHFVAGIHKGNAQVQTVLLTADAHIANQQNPLPGAQMLVTGTSPRNLAWEQNMQAHIAPFYASVDLGNRGARVRGGLSMEEGSSAAWHPLIERAAEYGPEVTIMEVSRAIDIVEQAGSIEAGATWAAPLFDAIAEAMWQWACAAPAEGLVCRPALPIPAFSNTQYQDLAARIFLNEGGGNPQHLTHWNTGENFPSMGIGHFIWFPGGVDAPFDETFPALVRYLATQPEAPAAPAWLLALDPLDAPWQDQQAFNAALASPELAELRQWLQATSEQQARFIVQRFVSHWNGLADSLPRHAALSQRLAVLTETPAGWFAVLDYFNFKGIGTNPRERYAGEGWGLVQVLADVDARAEQAAGNTRLLGLFSDAAAERLRQRVKNSPPARNEQRWLPGWEKRVAAYAADNPEEERL